MLEQHAAHGALAEHLGRQGGGSDLVYDAQGRENTAETPVVGNHLLGEGRHGGPVR